jgi:hypothetical protein
LSLYSVTDFSSIRENSSFSLSWSTDWMYVSELCCNFFCFTFWGIFLFHYLSAVNVNYLTLRIFNKGWTNFIEVCLYFAKGLQWYLVSNMEFPFKTFYLKLFAKSKAIHSRILILSVETCISTWMNTCLAGCWIYASGLHSAYLCLQKRRSVFWKDHSYCLDSSSSMEVFAFLLKSEGALLQKMRIR